MPTPTELAHTIIDALNALDVSDAPHGLYACHDLEPDRPPSSMAREWNAALQPALGRLGATDLYARSPFNRPSFHVTGLGECELNIRRIATIKVRRFGSAHRMDDRADRSARWADADLPSLLNALRYPRERRRKHFALVVLIAFAREATPLQRQLGTLAREMRGLESASRTWLDRYERAFSVRVAVWWAPIAAAV